jgi:hypothetical protein
MRDLIQEHLRAVVALLSGFVLASAVVLIADAPGWSRVLAALLAVVSLSLVVLWLRVPWTEWRARHGWRITAVAAPALLAIVVLALGMTVWRDDPPAIFTNPATLILFDSSEAMERELNEGGLKFEYATDELESQARDLGTHQLGLATFGIDDCGADAPPIDEVVTIGPSTAGRIQEKASDLAPTGRSNLVSAARNATGLLDPFQGSRRRLLVVTAGLDECGGELADLIADTRFNEIVLQWDLVGVGLSDEERAELEALPADDVTVYLADTSEQLKDVFRLVLFEEPIRDDLVELTDYVETDLRELLNSSIAAYNARPPRPEDVRRFVAVLRRRAAEGEERFGEFATEDERAVFAPVKELLQEQFELLQEAATAAERVAVYDEEHDLELSEETIPARNELVEEASAIVYAYNDNLEPLFDRIEAALEQLFADE